MTPEQFCYWLQGYCEINGSPPSDEEWDEIVNHLSCVFDKQTPSNPSPYPTWDKDTPIC